MQTLYFCPVVSYVFFLFFFIHLISAVADWMSAILPHMVALVQFKDVGLKRVARGSLKIQDAKNRHLDTIAQLCRAISSQLRHVSTIGKKPVKQQYLLHMSSQYGELWPTNGWDQFRSLGHPCKFQQVSTVTARHSSSRRQPNFAALNRGRHLYSAGWPSF